MAEEETRFFGLKASAGCTKVKMRPGAERIFS
jgi:hypothetical protein